MRCRKWKSLSLALAVASAGGCSVSWDAPAPQQLCLKNYVDAHFQHGGSYQHLELAFDKGAHQRTAFFTGESAVDLAYTVVSKLRLHLGAGLVDTNQVI